MWSITLCLALAQDAPPAALDQVAVLIRRAPAPVTSTDAPVPEPAPVVPVAPLPPPPVAPPPQNKNKSKSSKSSAHQVLRYEPRSGQGTPLVVSFVDDVAAAMRMSPVPGVFAFSPHRPVQSAWPQSAWLARDVDGDGCITSGRELFGSFTRIDARGGTADNGFTALDVLDDNGDGVIDANDAAFAELLLWHDDGDRRCSPSELSDLASAHIVALGVDFVDDPVCVADLCARERGAFAFTDANGESQQGALVDLHLTLRPVTTTN